MHYQYWQVPVRSNLVLKVDAVRITESLVVLCTSTWCLHPKKDPN